MFLSRNKKNNVYPCKPKFYYIKVGFKGVKIVYACYRDVCRCFFAHHPVSLVGYMIVALSGHLIYVFQLGVSKA